MSYRKKILLIDNDLTLCNQIKAWLEKFNYQVIAVSDGEMGLQKFRKDPPDLIITEVLLPKLDGLFVCKTVREASSMPILVVTSVENIADKVLALELGANEYLVKPISLKELEVRLRKNFQRHRTSVSPTKPILRLNNQVIDLNTQEILKEGKNIKLTTTETLLLELLIRNAGNTLAREAILISVWGYTPERYVDYRLVDVHISRLRAKIEDNPSSPDLILTVRGRGYMFNQY